MTNMNVIPVSQDTYIVNGCKVKITYAEDGDSMEVLQKLIHDTPVSYTHLDVYKRQVLASPVFFCLHLQYGRG